MSKIPLYESVAEAVDGIVLTVDVIFIFTTTSEL